MSKPSIPKLEKQTIKSRLAADKAVSASLDGQKWQLGHIEASIAQADTCQPVDHAEIKKMAFHWRRRK